MRRALTILTMWVFLVTVGTSAWAGPKILKLAHLNPQQPFENATGAMAAVFKSMVEAGTNGSIKVQIFPAGQLGNERESMEQVKIGVIQSYIASAGGMAPFYPLYGVLDIPFAVPNYAVAWKVFDGPFGDFLKKDIHKVTGFHVLGFGEAGGFFQLTNSVRPIKTVEDMKGLKMRTMTLPTHQNLMKTYGAAATPIAWAEVYTALQTGVADGQHNPIPIILLGKLFEVQKYLTLTNHIYSTYCWVMNDDFWKGLNKHERSVVNASAMTAIVAGRGLNRIIEGSDRGLPTLIEKGMEVNTPTPEAMTAFRSMGVESAMAFIKEAFGDQGVEIAKRFLKAIDEAKGEAGVQ
ncbi:MAG: C4-dicarboxylate ABC transporter substrate-binding protein [Dethiosulfovibrio peptidovorans]|nr:MAG: C4-dicarboxylate ABC transporter substrate-binding protein [Dethiosulfovibrio peptidovorans]